MPDSIFTANDARARLTYGNEVAELNCKIEVAPNGVIRWQATPVALATDTRWLMPLMVPSTEVMTPLRFQADVGSLGTLSSESAYITDHKTSSEVGKPNTIAVSGDLIHATLSSPSRPNDSSGLSVVYFAVGMGGFGVVQAESPIGTVSQTGSARITDYDLLCGNISIQASAEPMALDQWLNECDRLASRIFDMFSLAQGRFMRWSARQVQSETGVLELQLFGPQGSGSPQWPVFSPLDCARVLDLAVNHYTQVLCDERSLPIALEWFVHHPQYTELKLTSVMTALEHLVSVENHGKKDPKIVSKERFAEIRDAFEKVLAGLEPTSDQEGEQIAIIGRKLGMLNSSTLRDKIARYLEHFNVPMYGLSLDEVKAAVDARNDVVHEGKYDATETHVKLLKHVSLLRELVLRVFLTHLGYEGPYTTALGGLRQESFPPTPPEPVPQSPETPKIAH